MALAAGGGGGGGVQSGALHIINQRYPRLLGLKSDLKTFIGLGQLLCLLPAVLGLEYPGAFARTLNAYGEAAAATRPAHRSPPCRTAPFPTGAPG